MNALYVMIPATLFLVGIFLWGFIWSARSGQFDDLDTPSHRALLDDSESTFDPSTSTKNQKGTAT